MDAKELMIGDWVQNTNDNKGKVIGFSYYPELKEHNFIISYKGNDTTWSYPSMIKPIPLTKEMLEKNGFEFFDCSYFKDIVSITFLPSCIYFICHVYKGEVCDVIERHINYVHELQHLLRLCELADMANNFKIE